MRFCDLISCSFKWCTRYQIHRSSTETWMWAEGNRLPLCHKLLFFLNQTMHNLDLDQLLWTLGASQLEISNIFDWGDKTGPCTATLLEVGQDLQHRSLNKGDGQPKSCITAYGVHKINLRNHIDPNAWVNYTWGRWSISVMPMFTSHAILSILCLKLKLWIRSLPLRICFNLKEGHGILLFSFLFLDGASDWVYIYLFILHCNLTIANNSSY
jgi:hypothetical protein